MAISDTKPDTAPMTEPTMTPTLFFPDTTVFNHVVSGFLVGTNALLEALDTRIATIWVSFEVPSLEAAVIEPDTSPGGKSCGTVPEINNLVVSNRR
jgi:hypothetical protein